MTALDELPAVDSFFGIDLKTGSLIIATIGIIHPMAYGSSFFVPLSYLLVTIWILVALFFSASVVLFVGLMRDDPLLCTVWVWYTVIFVVLMLMLMILLALVSTSRNQRNRVIVALLGMLWYILTIYFILVVNSYRKQLVGKQDLTRRFINEDHFNEHETMLVELLRITLSALNHHYPLPFQGKVLAFYIVHFNVLVASTLYFCCVKLVDCTNYNSDLLKMYMNETFKVASLFQCNMSSEVAEILKYNALWRQTVLGCIILELLQEVHQFNISYVYQDQDPARDVTTEIQFYLKSSEIDFYLRPMSLRVDVSELANPIAFIFDWDFGFTISYPDPINRNFYSKPFTRTLWNILYAMAFFSSALFYFLKTWENSMTSGPERERECSFGYELLMVLGAYCQHIPPIEARLLSRRIAYFVFFLFAYVVYTYYTSNLLSHLVNDKNVQVTLDELLNSGEYDSVILKNVQSIFHNNVASIYSKDNMSKNFEKLMKLKPVTLEEGLKGVSTTKVALLSDYFTIAPYLTSVFTSTEMCNLAQIDVVSSIKKYFFVSKTFAYMEEFKLTLLRAKESGLLDRLLLRNYQASIDCTPLTHVETKFEWIVHPLSILVGACVLCLVMLGVETYYYRRYRVWPYVN